MLLRLLDKNLFFVFDDIGCQVQTYENINAQYKSNELKYFSIQAKINKYNDVTQPNATYTIKIL